VPNPCLVPLDRPPYYAARVVLGDLGTKGGLVTDADGRVLDGNGVPIPGLYGSSNSCASLSRHRYPGPGIPLGTSMAASYRAVRDLLAASGEAAHG
jgi:predicted oxidoreductase